MKPAGPLIDELWAATDAVEKDDRNAVLRSLNHAYMEMAGLASWAGMRRAVTVVNGDWLPADLVSIDAVYDADGNIYHQREKSNIYLKAADPVMRFFVSEVRTSPSAEGTGLTVTSGQKTISFSSTPAEAVAGAFMTIEGVDGFWKLASANELVDTYHGETKNGAWYQIGPIGQKKIGLIDDAGEDDPTQVTVDYWAYPRPVFSRNDIILLPDTEALMLRTLRRFYKITKKDLPRGVSFNDEYEAALGECLAKNPRYMAPSFPTRLDGVHLGWGAARQ
jgi:hypothetical protein